MYADDVLTFIPFVDPVAAVFISLRMNFAYLRSYKVVCVPRKPEHTPVRRETTQTVQTENPKKAKL